MAEATKRVGRTGTLLNGFTVGGNGLDGDQKVLLSAIELEAEKVLMNYDYNIFTRLTETPAHMSDLIGYAVAIYTKVNRVIWGKDYNELTGSQKQIGSAKRMSVNIDQFLTVNFVSPEFDMKRLRSNPALAATLAAEWNSQIVINKLMELELIFLNAVKLYTTWRYQYDKSSILVLDFDKVKDSQSAEEVFYALGERMLEKITTITKNEIGTNQKDWSVFFSPKAWLKLSRVYTKFVVSDIGAKTLATGSIYYDQILGTGVQKHIYLDNSFLPGTETAMNTDVAWDLRGFDGFASHNRAWAFPMGFQKLDMVIDNDTLNPKIIGKIMFGLPAAIRGNLTFGIMNHEPTSAEIEFANSMVYEANSGAGDYTDNLKYAFQLTSEDKALSQAVDKNGTKNLTLFLEKGEGYVMAQLQGFLKLQANETVILFANQPSLKVGETKTDKDIKELSFTPIKDIKDGTNYYVAVLSKKTADNNQIVAIHKIKVSNGDYWGSELK